MNFIIGIVIFTLFSGIAGGQALNESAAALDDGLTLRERTKIYGDISANCKDGRAIQDVVIVDKTRPVAYFGMYRTSQMTAPGWDMYERMVDWANGFKSHTTTMIWLATYNGTLDPKYSAEKDGIAVYNYLINNMSVPASNIHVDHQSSIETASFSGYDIVLYVHTYPRDATNVMNQKMPFVTTCGGETDELGIGTGVAAMHSSRNYATGQFTLTSNMWMDATEAAGNGEVLITAETMPLLVNPMTFSATAGGLCIFLLDAGSVNLNRKYYILGSVSGTSPGTNLPKGLVLPLNFDLFTGLVIKMTNTPVFANFSAQLDSMGLGIASMNTYGPTPPSSVGLTMDFAYVLHHPIDYVSNPVKILIGP